MHRGREIVDREQLVDEPVGLLAASADRVRSRSGCDVRPPTPGGSRSGPASTEQTNSTGPTTRSDDSSSRSRSAGSAQWMSSTITTSGVSAASAEKNDLQPAWTSCRTSRGSIDPKSNSGSATFIVKRERRGRPTGIGGHILGQQLAARLADLLERQLRRVRVQDPRVALEDLRERPVGDPLAVREAASSDDGGAVSLRPQEELRGQPALPHAGVAVDRDEVRPALGRRSAEYRQEQRELLVAPHHRRVEPRNPAILDGCGALQQLHRGHRLLPCP